MERSIKTPLVCPTIVGRDSELAALQTIANEVEDRHSHLLLLSGEAGIGKSRLVAALETNARERGFLVLQGNCYGRDRTIDSNKIAQGVVKSAKKKENPFNRA